MQNTEWFVESATPVTTHAAWHRDADGKPVTWGNAVFLIVERRYHTDAKGYRHTGGGDWIDSRIRLIDLGSDGRGEDLSEPANLIGYFPIGESPAVE